MLPKLDVNSTKPIKDNEALHVFIFDDQETTLQKCMNMYGSRSKNNKEYWLFDTTKGIDNRLPLNICSLLDINPIGPENYFEKL